jgi:hypothetical protein
MPKVMPVRFCGRSEMCPTNRRMFGCCAWSLLHNSKIGHSIGDAVIAITQLAVEWHNPGCWAAIFTCARPACVAECATSPARSAVTRHSACGRTGGPRLPFQANLLRFRAFPGRGLACSSAARLQSDTLTIVVLSCVMKAPARNDLPDAGTEPVGFTATARRRAVVAGVVRCA